MEHQWVGGSFWGGEGGTPEGGRSQIRACLWQRVSSVFVLSVCCNLQKNACVYGLHCVIMFATGIEPSPKTRATFMPKMLKVTVIVIRGSNHLSIRGGVLAQRAHSTVCTACTQRAYDRGKLGVFATIGNILSVGVVFVCSCNMLSTFSSNLNISNLVFRVAIPLRGPLGSLLVVTRPRHLLQQLRTSISPTGEGTRMYHHSLYSATKSKFYGKLQERMHNNVGGGGGSNGPFADSLPGWGGGGVGGPAGGGGSRTPIYMV